MCGLAKHGGDEQVARAVAGPRGPIQFPNEVTALFSVVPGMPGEHQREPW